MAHRCGECGRTQELSVDEYVLERSHVYSSAHALMKRLEPDREEFEPIDVLYVAKFLAGDDIGSEEGD